MATQPDTLQTAIPLPRDVIEAFCRRWKIAELALFGSILRDDFGPDSDIDFLVTCAPDAGWSLMDLVGMEYELEDLLGRKVDLISRRGIERSRNWIRREEILSTARVYYAAG
jgi:predicted nucleotidyltransferase